MKYLGISLTKNIQSSFVENQETDERNQRKSKQIENYSVFTY